METRYRWDPKPLTPLQVIEKYQGRFPIIVQVKEGYSGDNSWDCLSQSEIYRIHASKRVRRALCHDERKTYFSVPLDYKNGEFMRTGSQGGRGKLLSKLLSSHPPPRDITWANSDGVRKSFTVTRVYEARYMLANRIKSDSIDQHVVIIPSYARGTLIVAKHSPDHPKFKVKDIDYSSIESLCLSGILMYASGTVKETFGSSKALPVKEEAPIYESLEPETVYPHMYQSMEPEAEVYEECKEDVSREIITYHTVRDPRKSEYEKRSKTEDTHASQFRPPLPSRNTTGTRSTFTNRNPISPPQWNDITDHDQGTDNAGEVLQNKDEANCSSPAWPEDMDISKLSQADVLKCLEFLNMKKYIEQFEVHQINGSLLVSLDEQTMVDDLNMSRLDAKKLTKFCKGWRPG